ncbi:E3 ubiquitin-protein ligase UPL7 [Pycnococcus provasolii]
MSGQFRTSGDLLREAERNKSQLLAHAKTERDARRRENLVKATAVRLQRQVRQARSLAQSVEFAWIVAEEALAYLRTAHGNATTQLSQKSPWGEEAAAQLSKALSALTFVYLPRCVARTEYAHRGRVVLAIARTLEESGGESSKKALALAQALAWLAAAWRAGTTFSQSESTFLRWFALAAAASICQRDERVGASGASAILALSTTAAQSDVVRAAYAAAAAGVALSTKPQNVADAVATAATRLVARCLQIDANSSASCSFAFTLVAAQTKPRKLPLPKEDGAASKLVVAVCSAFEMYAGDADSMSAAGGVAGCAQLQDISTKVRLNNLAALVLACPSIATSRAFVCAASASLEKSPALLTSSSRRGKDDDSMHLLSSSLAQQILQHAPPSQHDAAAVFFARIFDSDATAQVMASLTAFVVTKGVIADLWHAAAKPLGVAANVPQAVADKLGVSVWDPPSLGEGDALARSNQAVRARLCVVARAVRHDLATRSDDDMHADRASLPVDELRALAAAANVVMFRACAFPSHSRTAMERRDGFDTLSSLSAVLAELHDRNERQRFVPADLWIAPARAWVKKHASDPNRAAANARAASTGETPNAAVVGGLPRVLRVCPHVIPFEIRARMLRSWVSSEHIDDDADGGSPHRRETVTLAVRRGNELADAMTQLTSYSGGGLSQAMKLPWHVTFVEPTTGQPEAGVDQGGLSHELLTILARGVLNPNFGLFQAASDTGWLFPRAAAPQLDGGLSMLTFAGAVVARCMREGQLMEASVAPGVLAPAASSGTRRLGLSHLASRDAVLYSNLVKVLDYEGDVENDLCLAFVCPRDTYGGSNEEEVELVPGGADRAVTRENRRLYVHLVADFRCNVEPAAANRAFLSGLCGAVDPRALALFSPLELSRLISGDEDARGRGFDVDDLAKHTEYSGGYTAQSRTVAIFWRVVRGLSAEQKSKLLMFVTGCPRPPLLGFAHLQPHAFRLHKVSTESAGGIMSAMLTRAGLKTDIARLPTASTCFNQLKLPNYKTEAQMRSKLMSALDAAGDGFHLS